MIEDCVIKDIIRVMILANCGLLVYVTFQASRLVTRMLQLKDKEDEMPTLP